MISLNKIQTKFFKREKKFRKEHSSLDMNFYWQLAVSLIFISIPILLFFGYQFFMEVNQEYVPSANNNIRQATVKKERIQKVLEYFSLKKQKSEQIIKSAAPVVDPSL